MNIKISSTIHSFLLCTISTGILFLLLTPMVFTESLTIQDDSVAAGFQTASADATLSTLAITGVPFNESFSSEKLMYTAETSMTEVTVSAVAAHDSATVAITPSDMNSEEDGHQITLGEGTTIGVTVTAEDGTTAIYTVTVTRPAPATTDETVPLIESEPESDTQQTSIGPISKIIATPGDGEVTVTWATSSIAGVIGWQFDYKTQAAGSWTGWADVPSSTASTTSHTIASLTNGTAYFFRIQAKGSSDSTGTAAEAVGTPNAGISSVRFDSDGDNLVEITTLAQLNAMRYDADGDGFPGGSTANKNAYYEAFKTSRAGFFCTACAGYELMNDLDFDTDGDGKTWTGTIDSPTADSGDTYYNGGGGWQPIGYNNRFDDQNLFTTTFNGNGFVIKNLYISRPTTFRVGLFGYLSTGGVVANVGLHNVYVSGFENTGALVGENLGGTVRTSYVIGGLVKGDDNSGGLVGENAGPTLASYARVNVTAQNRTNQYPSRYLGGFVGQNESSGSIKYSYSTGTVSATAGRKIGGFVGDEQGGSVTDSYWDGTTSGVTDGEREGGTRKTTAELQNPIDYGTTGIYSTWDDDNIDGLTGTDAPWGFGTDTQYPFLTIGGHQADNQYATAASIIATPGNAQATLTWKGKNTFATTGWQFTYKTQVGGTWSAWADVPSSTASTTSHTVASLTNGTTYLFKVRAVGGAESAVAVAVPGTGIPATDFDSNDNNLIEITTLAQLHAMRYDLDGDGVPDSGTSIANVLLYYTAFRTSQVGFFCESCVGYELMNELDFDTDDDGSTWTEVNSVPTGDSDDTYNNSGSGWEPIGSSSGQFATTFDGNGFVISNLYISRGSSSNVGLFGVVSTSGVVTAVALKDVFVAGGTSTGALAGRNDGTISVSYTAGSVTGESNNTGGLVGLNNNGTIIASYSTASVSANAGTNHRVGGLVGSQNGSSAAISNSYSIGSVTGGGTNVGGLLGRNSAGAITTSYWDTETSGQAVGSGGGGTGKTTRELQTPTDYTGTIYATWDDDNIDGVTGADAPWNFGTDSEYPVLTFGGHQADVQRGSSFTLDLDKSGTFVARQDLLGTYLYLAEGISTSQLRTYTHNQNQDVANKMAELIDGSITGATPPLDFDGNATVAARQDVLGAYLYTAEGISATQLRAYTHNQDQNTANTMADTIDALIE